MKVVGMLHAEEGGQRVHDSVYECDECHALVAASGYLEHQVWHTHLRAEVAE